MLPNPMPSLFATVLARYSYHHGSSKKWVSGCDQGSDCDKARELQILNLVPFRIRGSSRESFGCASSYQIVTYFVLS